MTVVTDRARETFLETLRATCNVSAACRTAGISRQTAYRWRSEDEAFAAEWEDAEGAAIDALEGFAYERAMSGNSDRMIEILLKGHRPQRYVDRQRHEHSGPDGKPIAFTGFDIKFLD
jgi:hypothetical protein